jgi:hypothetical protein
MGRVDPLGSWPDSKVQGEWDVWVDLK